MGEIYQPPNHSPSNFTEKFNDLTSQLAKYNNVAYTVGNYNIDLFRYPHNPHSTDIIHDLASSSFFPLVLRATGADLKLLNLTDNIFTNDCLAAENSETSVIKNCTSDHFPIWHNISGCNTEKPSPAQPPRVFS